MIHDRLYLFLIKADWLGDHPGQPGQLIETKRASRLLCPTHHRVKRIAPSLLPACLLADHTPQPLMLPFENRVRPVRKSSLYINEPTLESSSNGIFRIDSGTLSIVRRNGGSMQTAQVVTLKSGQQNASSVDSKSPMHSFELVRSSNQGRQG